MRLLLGLLLLSGAVLCSLTPKAKKNIHDIVHDYGIAYGSNAVDSNSWRITAFGEMLDLELEPNHELFRNDYAHYEYNTDTGKLEKIQESADYIKSCMMKGKVRGDPNSHVFLSTCGGALHGSITHSGGSLFVVPNDLHFDSEFSDRHTAARAQHDFHVSEASEAFSQAVPHVIYHKEDLKENSEDEFCGNDHSHVVSEEDPIPDSPETPIPEPGDFGGLQSDLRTIQMLIFNDRARVQDFSDMNAMLAHSATIVSNANALYTTSQNTFSPPINLVLVGQVSFTNSNPFTYNVCSTNAAEVDGSTLLSNFRTYWRNVRSSLPVHDSGHLFSGENFCGSTLGIAYVGSLCGTSSCGINQISPTGTATGSVVFAHELGHNAGMSHDGNADGIGDSCPTGQNVMSPFVSSSYTSFSTCSSQYWANRVGNFQCTINSTPCGNGMIDDGEECDCGSSDCSSLDPCCNGATCKLFDGNQCSSSDPCCDDSCQIAPSTQVCRSAGTPCDREELCNGISSSCPTDVFSPNSQACVNTKYESTFQAFSGLCFNGECESRDVQCLDRFLPSYPDLVYFPDNSCSRACDTIFRCRLSLDPTGSPSCYGFNGVFDEEGTKCADPSSQCIINDSGSRVCSSNPPSGYPRFISDCVSSCASMTQGPEVKCVDADGTELALSSCTGTPVIENCGFFLPEFCNGVSSQSGDIVTIGWDNLGRDVSQVNVEIQDASGSTFIVGSSIDNTGSALWTVSPAFVGGQSTVTITSSSSTSIVTSFSANIAGINTTPAPTTAAPTLAPTLSPTTVAPTTAAPTTAAPTTASPTTGAPTSATPTLAPSTAAPTTAAPTTAAPTTASPTTGAPTSASPTLAPSTAAPTTAAPTSAAPTTAVPTTATPTLAPTPAPTDAPTECTAKGKNKCPDTPSPTSMPNTPSPTTSGGGNPTPSPTDKPRGKPQR